MNSFQGLKYMASISFKSISLPPVRDILIIGKNNRNGLYGVLRSMELLNPEEFELIEVDDSIVEGLLVSRKILSKIDKEKLLSLLKNNVYPFITSSELIKVKIDLTVISKIIEIGD